MSDVKLVTTMLEAGGANYSDVTLA